MTRDYRAGVPVPPRDAEAFKRAKAQVDMALELRRQARAATQPIDPATQESPTGNDHEAATP